MKGEKAPLSLRNSGNYIIRLYIQINLSLTGFLYTIYIAL